MLDLRGLKKGASFPFNQIHFLEFIWIDLKVRAELLLAALTVLVSYSSAEELSHVFRFAFTSMILFRNTTLIAKTIL